MNNKIYLILLITALFAGANIQKANALEEFPELLPASAVDVRRMMNITPNDSAKRAEEKDIVEVSNKNLDKKALDRKLKNEKKIVLHSNQETQHNLLITTYKHKPVMQ